MPMTKKTEKVFEISSFAWSRRRRGYNTIYFNKRKKVHQMFLSRKIEGLFNILIENIYGETVKNSGNFFGWIVDQHQFNYVLNLIEEDIKTSPSIKVPDPITAAAEKLAVTLRLVKF